MLFSTLNAHYVHKILVDCYKCDDTRAETIFHLSAKGTSPFKLAEASIQSIPGGWGVRISGSNAGCTMFLGSVKSTGYPLHQFPLHFPSHASPCSITFQTGLLPSADKFKNNNSQNLEKLVWSSGHNSSPVLSLLLWNILIQFEIIHDRALSN